jgi:hypothetical protein
MSFMVYTIGGATALFMAMLVLLVLGRKLGRRHQARKGATPEGMGATDAAVIGLLSLVLAFTFSAAASRFDARRSLIIDETNAIVTAYLRLDLLAPHTQPKLRADFGQYIDSRLAAYDVLPDVKAAFRQIERSKTLQMQIWRDAMSALQDPATSDNAGKLVVPALNTMIDLGTTQMMAAYMHLPLVIFVMLVILALVSAWLIGYATAPIEKMWWLRAVSFTLLFTVTFFVILDLEYPRLGFIRLTEFDRELRSFRQNMASVEPRRPALPPPTGTASSAPWRLSSNVMGSSATRRPRPSCPPADRSTGCASPRSTPTPASQAWSATTRTGAGRSSRPSPSAKRTSITTATR